VTNAIEFTVALYESICHYWILCLVI